MPERELHRAIFRPSPNQAKQEREAAKSAFKSQNNNTASPLNGNKRFSAA